MIDFKYSLDKRTVGHNPKKFLCPACNKRTFVRYIETETANYLTEDLGRCDREANCGYFKTPETDSNCFSNSKKGAEFYNYAHAREVLPTSFHESDLISASGRNFKNNNFVQFLKTLFTDNEVKGAILKYLIGTSKHWNGATIFWQIDNDSKVRAGKVLQYFKESGKRYKTAEGKALINWVHSILKLESYNLTQCLFGLHLITETNTKTIAVVESEKTAVIMSIFKPEYVWLATGSKQGFKYEMLKAVKNYKVVAFPDKGEFATWQTKAQELNSVGFKIVVNDLLEQQDYPLGTDLADVFIKQKRNEANTAVLSHLNSITLHELILKKIEAQKPQIRVLIDVFDLTDEDGAELRKIA